MIRAHHCRNPSDLCYKFTLSLIAILYAFLNEQPGSCFTDFGTYLNYTRTSRKHLIVGLLSAIANEENIGLHL
jgi:hypothetical protein